MSEKKFGLLRGLSDIFICEIEDTEAEYKMVGTPEKLIPAGELTICKSVDKAQTYFDNSLFQEVGKENPSELSIVGGFLIASSGLSILGIKDCKTMNMLPALAIPLIFCWAVGLF